MPEKHASYRAFLSSKKSGIEISSWSEKKMPKSGDVAMVLTKGRSPRLGAGWRWCHIDVLANGARHRLWVCYHAGKENYQAVLAKEIKDDELFILAALESHGTHPGWHIHGCCAIVSSGAYGRARYPEMVRIPGPGKPHRHAAFPATDSAALDVAGRHFRIDELRYDPDQHEFHYE